VLWYGIQPLSAGALTDDAVGLQERGARFAHNVYPGPPDDPGRDALHQSSHRYGSRGFRWMLTDEPELLKHRCYCGCSKGYEHYGIAGYVDEDGVCWLRGRRVKA
jgi:hypothetical protein